MPSYKCTQYIRRKTFKAAYTLQIMARPLEMRFNIKMKHNIPKKSNTEITANVQGKIQNTQEVKHERFLIWTRQNNANIRQKLPSTKRRTDKQI